MAYMVLTLGILALIALFAAQNSGTVAVAFLFWKVEASLAVVVFLSVLAGGLIVAMIVLSANMKRIGKSKKEKL